MSGPGSRAERRSVSRGQVPRPPPRMPCTAAVPLVLALTLALGAPRALAAKAFGPFGSAQHPVTKDARPSTPASTRTPSEPFFRLSYDVYRQALSPMDGARCLHRPTCSRYGLLAVRRHGLVGMWLTVDRLLRGGHSSAVRTLRWVPEGTSWALWDPLEESTFWFANSP